MKTFTFCCNTHNYTIVCTFHNTRNGFKHVATLLENGSEIDNTKICYLNRTWERYEYQSVIHKLIDRNFTDTKAIKGEYYEN